MKRKIGVGILLMSGGIFLSTQAFAQASPIVVETGSVVNPSFFVAILSGVLMALGFQLVLTNLSVAAGISAAGNIRQKANDSKSEKSTSKQEDQSSENKMPLGVKILSGAGVWAIVTGMLSLFFASFFAVKLSLIPANGVGIALGLTIWAVFYFVMLYLEYKGASSLVNNIFSAAVGIVKTALSGAGSVLSGTGSLFRKSEEAKMEHVASRTVNKIEHDLKDTVNNSELAETLKMYLNKITPQRIDLHQLRDELADLLHDIRIEERNGEQPGERELILNVAGKDSRFSKEDVSAIDKLIDIGKSTLKVAGGLAGAGGIAAAVTAYLQHKQNKIDVAEVKHEVEDFIKQRGDAEVEPELVRAELDEIFKNESREKIKAHQIDKEYVAAIVAERKGVSRDRALKAADSVEMALNAILRESNISEIINSKVDEVKENVMDSVNSRKEEVVSGIENRIRSFLDKINRPELNYDLLKSEFEFMLRNPKETPEVLRRKLKQFDRDTLMGILSAYTRFSQNDVNKIALKFEEAKSAVLSRIGDTENTLSERMEDVKEYALEQAENTRKTAAAASWWLLATLTLTGLAAALGAMAGL